MNAAQNAFDNAPDANPATLILASTSRYRAQLMARLGIACGAAAPGVTEAHHAGEAPTTRAVRLADEKARAVARRQPACWILGADQVCACDGRLLDKPGTLTVATEQLRHASGRRVEFHTAVTLYRQAPPCHLRAIDHTVVRFRTLGDAEIQRYLATENVLDCAGSFKCEGLGISLCEAIETQDPTALIGLPLIAVRRLLAEVGIVIP